MLWRGMSNDALALLVNQSASSHQSGLTIEQLTLEAVGYTHLRQLRDAESRLAEAKKLCAASDDPACGGVLRAEGVLAIESGQIKQAHGFFEQSLSFARVHHDEFMEATALLNLGVASLQQELFDAAVDWSQKSYSVSKELGAEDLAQTALGNLGFAYYQLGDSERARDMFVQAESRAAQLGDSTDQISWLTYLGYIDADERNYFRAEETYTRALVLARQIDSKGDISEATRALARVSLLAGKLDQAQNYASQAVNLARLGENRRDEVYPTLMQGQVAALRGNRSDAQTIFQDVENNSVTPEFIKWEARHSLAQLYEGYDQSVLADHEYSAALATFEAARKDVHHEELQVSFLTNASRIYDDYIHFLVAKGKTNRALQIADYSRARTLAEGLGQLNNAASNKDSSEIKPSISVTHTSIQKEVSAFAPYVLNAQQIARRADGTVLFYWLGEKQSYLWAITGQNTKLFTLPPEAEIKAAVQHYRKSLVVPRDVLANAVDDGSALYRMLVAPAQDSIKRNSGRQDAKVFIIPDGVLNSLNFETLIVPDPKPHYWIEDATITNAASLHLLGASRSTNKGVSGNLLLMGDATRASPDFSPLANASVEMKDIQKHFPVTKQEVFQGDHANPPAYLSSRPERFSVIHFVAHGTASRLSPLDSAIILSKATTEEDSYKLYARDIIRHPLHAGLVTISTCSSAGDRAYSGEGLVGLSWAFLLAGAHNVVGALWEASDDSTPQLMDKFYEELQKGKSPSAALRSAKLTMLHSDTYAYRRPFYWATFQLYTGS
jgi:CHAT domain-containing protein